MPFSVSDYEKLGMFYLGRRYDLTAGKSTDELFLYDSTDLLTHAVCIGMTGSGKTGLCLDLIEEAAIDGVPVIAIDPKGDISNLLLTFPNLSKEEFLPWVSDDDAKRAGVSLDQFAEQQAQRWRQGLGEWKQDAERIQTLRNSADFVVYTPGSTAGRSVSIVGSLAAPSEAVRDDRDAFKERINSTAGPLLAMLGLDTDPLKSREHILLATILERTWSAGKDLGLADLIQLVQKPPVTTIGALDLESFFPSKDRFTFAMSINNLLAAPGFDAWLQGDPLSVDQFLYTGNGRPKVSIFSIAHLSDSERMFFVTILLSQIVSWMRSQSGRTSLRAILYMDEIFGYFPPIANPPSKLPLLTLLKQARAFGLGVVLASQNPVDLDYKGLANTGTWFIGRLQTERDKMRVLDGLEGAASEAGSKFDRQAMERVLAGLGKRIFLVNNVHADKQEVIESRWSLSYLRGPLTKSQIKTLMSDKSSAEYKVSDVSSRVGNVNSSTNTIVSSRPFTHFGSSPAATPGSNAAATSTGKSAAVSNVGSTTGRTSGKSSQADLSAKLTKNKPAVPPGIPEFFLPAIKRGSLTYKPMILGAISIRYVDTKASLDCNVEKVFLVELTAGPVPLNWSNASEHRIVVDDLLSAPEDGATFYPVPPAASKAQQYKSWSKDLVDWLVSRQKYYLLLSPSTGEYSHVNELEREFRIRLTEHLGEVREVAMQQLRNKYGPKVSSFQDKVMRAEQRVQKEQQEQKQHEMDAAISIGATVLGAITGRRALGRGASTVAREASRAASHQQDIDMAQQTLAALQQQFQDLQEEFARETEAVRAKYEARTEAFETVGFSPKKTNVSPRLVALVWAPYVVQDNGATEAAF